jgi:YegS/Rv2252/BmrU family lipid kinase
MARGRADRVLILNPESGGGRRTDEVRSLAEERGFDVRESRVPGGTLELAREAAAGGTGLIAAGGGDGTLNEVVRGVDGAGALDRVTIGVVPAGTGNDFADNVGIRGIEHAFSTLEGGRTRRLDLGVTDGRPFVNSCVGGLTAEASAATTREMKRRWGVLAYVISTLRRARSYEGLKLHLEATGHGDGAVWSGDAILVLIGNGRRFAADPALRAHVEDGLLDVVVIERMPAIDLVGRAAAARLLRRDADYLTRFQASAASLSVLEGRPVEFSLDGEIVSRSSLDVGVRPGALRFRVPESYRADPADRDA